MDLDLGFDLGLDLGLVFLPWDLEACFLDFHLLTISFMPLAAIFSLAELLGRNKTKSGTSPPSV